MLAAREIEIGRVGGVRLWAEVVPGPGRVPVLLVADADTSGVAWPDELVAALAAQHPVIRYDHRDTGRSRAPFPALAAVFARAGRSTGAVDALPPDTLFDGGPDEEDPDDESDGVVGDDLSEDPYGLPDLADDALTVLDAAGFERAHVVGLGMGGLITQLLLLDHPERVATATLLAGGPLPGPGVPPVPGPTPAVTRLWAELDDPRDDAGELAWRLAELRLLHGSALPFDAAAFLARAERVIAHAGTAEPATCHRRLGPPPDRGGELGGVRVPVLVIEAPEDPVEPPPRAEVLAGLLGTELVCVPGMGRVIPPAAVQPLVASILTHTARNTIAV